MNCKDIISEILGCPSKVEVYSTGVYATHALVYFKDWIYIVNRPIMNVCEIFLRTPEDYFQSFCYRYNKDDLPPYLRTTLNKTYE